jgi:pyruvate formate lyase activating enzyme
LLDLKHANALKHESLTGVKNDKIKVFTKYLSDIGKPVWIRYVLVPGYTDSIEDLIAAHNYLKQFKHIQKIEVLPYHSMGKVKWDNLNLEYPLEGVQPPTPEQVAQAKRIITAGRE